MCGQADSSDRLNQTDGAGGSEEDRRFCRTNEPQSGWWLKGFGYFGSQGADQGFEGYDARIYGVMLAYDIPLDPDTRAGLGFGYARTNIDGKALDTQIEVNPSPNSDPYRETANTYNITAYIDHESGPWFVYGDISAGLSQYSDSLNIAYPGINQATHAGYNGQDYTGFVTTGYHFRVQEFTVTPLASLQYTHVDLDGYTQSGADNVSLSVKPQSYDFLESGLGVKIARPFASENGTFVPEVHFEWLHELNNPTMLHTASFTFAGAGSLTGPGLTAAADTLDVGVGLTLLSCGCTGRTWSIEAVYDYQWTDDHYTANKGTLKFSYRFGGDSAAGMDADCRCMLPAAQAKIAAGAPLVTVAKSYLVFFDFDRSDLTPEATGIVKQAAANAGPAKATEIDVTGHTDTMGSDAYNMRLSRRRAESVAAQLENDGIPASEIAIFAKGKRDLLVPTADGVREPQNRRVQIVYSGGPTS